MLSGNISVFHLKVLACVPGQAWYFFLRYKKFISLSSFSSCNKANHNKIAIMLSLLQVKYIQSTHLFIVQREQIVDVSQKNFQQSIIVFETGNFKKII